ncbi:antitoxin [Deinococcus rubellus]|uniref:antitoxin n=1 Tax=Deinococcus rubellus TaxID=1889240 RepID=UPI0031EB6DD8
MVYGKVFKSGNSQAVRLPKSVRVSADEMEIVVRGDALILRPGKATNLTGAFDALASIGPDFLPEGRDQGSSEEREEF